MSEVIKLVAADGVAAQAVFDGQSLTFQFLQADGTPAPNPLTLAAGSAAGFVHSGFAAAALSTGGFQVAWLETDFDAQGNGHIFMKGADIAETGALTGEAHPNFSIFLANTSPDSQPTFAAPAMYELGRGEFALVYESDASLTQTLHVAIGDAAGVLTDTTIAGISDRPDAITQANGDITLTFGSGAGATQEILGPDGAVLTARQPIAQFSAEVASGTSLSHFTQASQITLTNNDGSIAGGTRSTLTYVVGSHTLIWDPDSEGPAPATTAAVLPSDVNHFTVANLASNFRPEVLKVVQPDGSESITWFDSDNSQTWDTLQATLNIHGQVTTYGSTLDQGHREQFTFDVDNSQAYTRYVDDFDAAGHLLTRTVLYDDNTSWSATFTYADGQVVSYERDNFDANGVLVARGFFHADGTPI